MEHQNITYIKNTIQRELLSRQYEEVGIVDVRDESYSPIDLSSDEVTEKQQSYGSYCDDVCMLKVVSEERKNFSENTELSNVVRSLENSNSYFFTINCISDGGERRLKKYTFFYLDKKRDIIIIVCEDITGILERDVLTGELNRRGFKRVVKKIMDESSDSDKYTILFFDIRNFKMINELFGYQGGDNVLRSIPSLIKNSELKPLAIARFESDHFLCICKQERFDIDVVSKLLFDTYTQNYKTITMEWICGIYHVKDNHMNVEGMFDRARLAKEFVTRDTTRWYAVYDKSMKDAYVARNTLDLELKNAIHNKEFVVYYQPIYEAKTGKIASAEALVRWLHPKKGIVSPGLFIPHLEENGRISLVDLYVERNTREFLENRVKRGMPVVPVDINLSWLDFYDEQVICDIMEDLVNTTLPGSCVRIEVTESSYSSMAENNTRVFHSMKKRGLKLLVDDFGSGYSSFSTIRDYEFDIIKIDMGFVQKIGESRKTENIIRAIIDMAHHMNILVIAEGAETEEQVDFLRENGCDYIQGYYFSKPLPQDEFDELLNTLI